MNNYVHVFYTNYKIEKVVIFKDNSLQSVNRSDYDFFTSDGIIHSVALLKITSKTTAEAQANINVISSKNTFTVKAAVKENVEVYYPHYKQKSICNITVHSISITRSIITVIILINFHFHQLNYNYYVIISDF